MGLMAPCSKRAYAIPKSAAPSDNPCIQSPWPFGSPLMIHTLTGDTQTQFCLSLCWFSVSWCTQGLFESSESLWQVSGLILNVISPLLPSCWSFSFALGCGCCCCCCWSVASVVSNSVRPQRWQPTRLPHPWDSLGKNAGVGCHFLIPQSHSSAAQPPLQHQPSWGASLPFGHGVSPHSNSSVVHLPL